VVGVLLVGLFGVGGWCCFFVVCFGGGG